jgi:hypothetical protein
VSPCQTTMSVMTPLFKAQCCWPLWGKPILGWYHWEPPQGMIKKSKVPKLFYWAIFSKCIHNHKLIFSQFIHCMPCLLYWMEPGTLNIIQEQNVVN